MDYINDIQSECTENQCSLYIVDQFKEYSFEIYVNIHT